MKQPKPIIRQYKPIIREQNTVIRERKPVINQIKIRQQVKRKTKWLVFSINKLLNIDN